MVDDQVTSVVDDGVMVVAATVESVVGYWVTAATAVDEVTTTQTCN
jgi:hypothetical protein